MNRDEIMETIKSGPHWRVRFRPSEYRGDRLPTLLKCTRAVEQSRVVLRGWDYPHLSRDERKSAMGSKWISSMASFMGHIEYWRLYQSAQFIHHFAVHESIHEEAKSQVMSNLRGHLNYMDESTLDRIPGAFSLKSFIWTIAEIYEFATRLYEHVPDVEGVTIDISLRNCRGFALSTDWGRCWNNLYQLSEDCTFSQRYELADLISGETKNAEDAVSWFFERFGWLEQNTSMIHKDIQELFRS